MAHFNHEISTLVKAIEEYLFWHSWLRLKGFYSCWSIQTNCEFLCFSSSTWRSLSGHFLVTFWWGEWVLVPFWCFSGVSFSEGLRLVASPFKKHFGSNIAKSQEKLCLLNYGIALLKLILICWKVLHLNIVISHFHYFKIYILYIN